MHFKLLPFALTLFMLTTEVVWAETSEIWQVTPDTCITATQASTCDVEVSIALKTKLTGEHCLFLDSEKLRCFEYFPAQLKQHIVLQKPSILALLDIAGLTIAEQKLVIQYIKNKRRRTRAPWSLI